MVTGVACGLQNRYGAFARPGWVRFPHVPASFPTRTAVVAALILLGLAAPGLAQEPPPAPPPPGPDSAAVRADTIPPISPIGALLRSLVLPGWGQARVGRPARGAVYFGAASAGLYMVFKSAQKLSAAKRADPQDQALIDSRTRQRENWIVLTAFIAFVSGLDAWVSTHFWDFEPSILGPAETDGGVGFGFRVAVP